MKKYFFYGENFIDREQAILDLIKEEKIKEGIVKLHGDEDITWYDVIEKIESSGGLFSTLNLLWVRNIESIKNPKGSKNVEDEFIDFLEKNFDLPIILVLEATKIDKRKKLYKYILRNFKVEKEFKWPYENQILKWIEEKAKKKGLILDQESLYYIAISSSIYEIDKELEKIKIFAEDLDGNITKDFLIEVIGLHKIESVYSLQDAIIDKNINRFLRIYDNLVRNGENIHTIFYVITSTFERLLYISVNLNKSVKDIGKELGIPFFIIASKKWIDKVKKYHSSENIIETLTNLNNLEFAFKTGYIKNLNVGLESIILDYLNGESKF